MRRLLLGLALLAPITAWGSTTRIDEQRYAEEDICIAKAEYQDARTLFSEKTRGAGFSGSASPQARLSRDYRRKELRYQLLLQRYKKKYGKDFKEPCTLEGVVVREEN